MAPKPRSLKHYDLGHFKELFCFIFVSAQFFDAFTSGKEFFTGGEAEDKSSQQNSGYGAPQASYGAPAPSYGAPTQRPSYHAKPSYHGGGKGVNFKQIEIPVPDIDLPSPLEFKAGVLRSKGRIASGLLHAKAGILRAGANILAQKANTLDKIAQAIPAVKAGLIQKLKGSDKGYGGRLLAPDTTRATALESPLLLTTTTLVAATLATATILFPLRLKTSELEIAVSITFRSNPLFPSDRPVDPQVLDPLYPHRIRMDRHLGNRSQTLTTTKSSHLRISTTTITTNL